LKLNRLHKTIIALKGQDLDLAVVKIHWRHWDRCLGRWIKIGRFIFKLHQIKFQIKPDRIVEMFRQRWLQVYW